MTHEELEAEHKILKQYVDYLKDNLEKGIQYQEYLADRMNDAMTYTDTIGGFLNFPSLKEFSGMNDNEKSEFINNVENLAKKIDEDGETDNI